MGEIKDDRPRCGTCAYWNKDEDPTGILKINSLTGAKEREEIQRRYHIPCKHCGEFQFLEFDGIDGKGGMKFDRLPNGDLIVDSVRYECIKCGKPHYEVDKYNMMQAGEWRATATTSNRKVVSNG
jgi:phage terminase large subunit GpA-like protein